MIEFSCPNCGKRYKVSDSLSGKKAKCSCDWIIIVGDGNHELDILSDDDIVDREFNPNGVEPSCQVDHSVEVELYSGKPKMLRGNPLLFSFFSISFLLTGFSLSFLDSLFILPLIFVGICILFFWWISTFFTKLTITNKRVCLRKGILFVSTNELYNKDIRNVQVKQDLLQIVFSTGDILLHSAANSGVIKVDGMASPKKIKRAIDKCRKDLFPDKENK